MSVPKDHSGFTRRGFLRSASAAGVASLICSTPELMAMQAASPGGQDPTQQPTKSPAQRAEVGELKLHTLTPIPIEQVRIEDEFWTPKRDVWQTVTIRDLFTKFEKHQTGTFNNFDRVRAGERGNHAGDPWWDGLVYEMIRGSADFLRSHPDPELEQQIDGYIVRIVAAAQTRPDGYINTYTELVEPGHEWGLNGGFQLWQHEIYNLGALVEAAVHYYRATGKTTLLVAAVRISNTMYDLMGPPPKKNIVPCHPLPEEAMVRLYELFRDHPDLKTKLPVPVNEANYLKLAEFWIENRGNNIGKPDWTNHKAGEQFVRNQEYGSGRPSWGAYAQDDASVFEQKDIHGHAVRATLLCAGIAAAARVNNDERYLEAANRLWESMVYRRMYLTGGVGSFADDERFGPDYMLPNHGYCETCAAVGAGFFHHNMNTAFGHARYADELERVLYNGALSGVSLKGDTYFYENPLAADPSRKRWAWNGCPCCPPMFLKFMGAMPSYIYATDPNSIYVNLFVGSSATTTVNGVNVAIRQTTQYPWKGAVRIAVDPEKTAAFAVMLRIPDWCNGESIKVNGKSISASERVRGYVRIDRTWSQKDVIDLSMPMPVRQLLANPLVEADLGRCAVTRGPIVFCAESADNPEISQLLLSRSGPFTASFDSSLLGGVVVIAAKGSVSNPTGQGLYSATPLVSPPHSATISVIPYFANANRGPVNMSVWLPFTT
jgi:DUF1680 family protein